ncbi:MAG: hypothetical protein ABIA78_01765 [archaeon]
MKQKKRGMFLSFLFLIILLIGFVSADNCSITTRASCSDYTIMGLSALTNAHGELSSQSNYNYVLCCDFGNGVTNCDGANKIIGLSDVTNAHAEIPSLNNYDSDVCYSNLACASNSGSCLPGYDIQMLSLSDDTNAHIGEFGDYPVKICCGSVCVPDCTGKECGSDGCAGTCPPGCVPPETCDINGICISQQVNAYWASANNPIIAIAEIEVIPESTQVSLILRDVGLPENTPVSFEIYENDFFIDDDIRVGSDAITGVVNSQGDAIEKWTITQEDLDKTFDLEEFYFIVNGQVSGDLAMILSGGSCVNINSCLDYTEQETCEQDICVVADDSVNINNPDITCGDGYICECWWNISEGICSPKFTGIPGPSCGNGVINPGETCDGTEFGDLTCTDINDCTGGSLSCNPVTCLIDSSQCTGCTTGGICGDEIVQIPNNDGLSETCDGSNWGQITGCGNIDDFPGGTLSCYAPGTSRECRFDTSLCEESAGSSDTSELGTCKWDYTNTDYDCTDGYISYSAISYIDWPADNSGWFTQLECISGTGGNSNTCVLFSSTIESKFDDRWHYDPLYNSENQLLTQCYSKSDTLECPTQIQLAFFGFYNLIIAFILITLIYVVLIQREKH